MNAPLKHDTNAIRLPTPTGLTDTQREVLEAIRAFPGRTYVEIADLLVLPSRKGRTPSNVIVRQIVGMLRRRELVNLGYKKPAPPHSRPERIVFPVTPETPFDPAAGLETRRKLKCKNEATPTVKSVGKSLVYDEALAALEAELAELRDFKAMALTRYPDLAVPEIVLRARKIAAAEFEDATTKAGFLGGQKDKSPIMRAIIAALEGGA